MLFCANTNAFAKCSFRIANTLELSITKGDRPNVNLFVTYETVKNSLKNSLKIRCKTLHLRFTLKLKQFNDCMQKKWPQM